MTQSPLYNFRLAPEAIWLIVNTVIGASLTTLMTTDFGTITDWRAWAFGFGIAIVRTAIGALLAQATGGGFQKPNEPGPAPVTVDAQYVDPQHHDPTAGVNG